MNEANNYLSGRNLFCGGAAVIGIPLMYVFYRACSEMDRQIAGFNEMSEALRSGKFGDHEAEAALEMLGPVLSGDAEPGITDEIEDKINLRYAKDVTAREKLQESLTIRDI